MFRTFHYTRHNPLVGLEQSFLGCFRSLLGNNFFALGVCEVFFFFFTATRVVILLWPCFNYIRINMQCTELVINVQNYAKEIKWSVSLQAKNESSPTIPKEIDLKELSFITCSAVHLFYLQEVF